MFVLYQSGKTPFVQSTMTLLHQLTKFSKYNHNKIDFLHKRSRTMTVGDGRTGTDRDGRTGTDGDGRGRTASGEGLTYEPNTQFCA